MRILRVEAPRPHVCEIVVQHAAKAALQRQSCDLAEPRPFGGECGMIGRRELLEVELGRCQQFLQRLAPGERGAKLGLAGSSHPGEPFEPIRIERGQAG
jgi:hypothetical protein